MHLLDNDSASRPVASARASTEALCRAANIWPTRRRRRPRWTISTQLEAQSIYIFREAFARLKKLALLWSLGKDSNVMIWLARKAFFGRVPFPALHVDTGKKFPEMYAFRDRYGKEWELDLKVEPCPPIDAVDPTLPPAARSAARKTEGLKLALDQIRLRRTDRRHPPRRGSHPRQGARVLAARHSKADGTCAISRRNSGTSSTPRRRRARICASIRSCIGPRPTSGPTPSAKTSRSSRSISRRTASAIARWATPDITNPGGFDRLEHRRNPDRARRHQGAGARRPRARSRNRRRLRAAARRRLSLTDIELSAPMNMIVPTSDLGDAQRHHASAGSHRHRRPCRSRQVDAGRPPAARDRQPARRQARNAESRQRAARHAVRMVVPARCAADRARPGHHHRHHADPLPHPLARRRADRRARPRRIPAQHDHRRLAGRRRGADHRRAGRRARPDPAARLSAASARRQTGRRRRQQDGPRRFQRGRASRRSATRFPRI